MVCVCGMLSVCMCVYRICACGVLLYGGQGASLNVFACVYVCVCADLRRGTDSGGHVSIGLWGIISMGVACVCVSVCVCVCVCVLAQ